MASATSESRSVSWAAIATAVLIPLVFMMGPYALKGYVSAPPLQPAPVVSTEDLRGLERRVSAMETAVIEQASTNREIKAEQERQGKLIEGIARRMGILVAR